jgi:uncharacterized repeat protein (TIGR03837 family)
LTDFSLKPRWDIFCKIVDNFGDIGVCWRLARQLHVKHDLEIRLWIDDLSAAQAIITSLSIEKNQQICDGINIEKWDEAADFSQAAEVVIETFACGLPQPYLMAMQSQKTKWVNLEYLSAESWVNDFHGKPSPQANGLTRHFYFPGFTELTGGLIRERNTLESRQQLDRNDENVLKISLFCYQNAPINDLFNALQGNNHAVCVYVPATSILPKIAEFFGKDSVKVGDKLRRNNLTVEILPFLSQADYDQLLQQCDLNFVRGEDSWLRAIWAGKPFIWQPYVQEEDAHMQKLDAFLNVFYANYDKKDLPCEAHRYWSAGQLPKDVLNDYLEDLKDIQTYAHLQSVQLASRADLATKLVIFCNKI